MGKSHHNNRSKQSKGNKNSNHDTKNKKPTNNKFKQRSSQNMKQLAKLDAITGRNRSNQDNGNKDNKRDVSKSKDNYKKGGKGFERSGSQSRGRDNQRNGSKSFSRDKVQGNNNRGNNNGKFDINNKNNYNRNGNNLNNNKKYNNNKTKQIGKFKGKNPFQNDDDQQDQRKQIPIKGNPLFKIIPQGMNDQFAALGGSDSQEENQQYEEQGKQMEGQFEDQIQNQKQYEQDQDMQQDNQEQIDEDDIQDQLQGKQYSQEQAQEDNFDQEAQELDEEQEQQENQAYYQQGQQQEQDQQQIRSKKQSKHIKNQQNVKNQQNQQQQEADQQQQQNQQPVDISVISLKIQETIQILMNVQKLGGGKSRKHHLQQLKKMIHQYYGYNYELINHFLDFLNPAQMIQLFEANETHRPLTIRTNTLKTRRKQLAQSLIQRGVNLDPLAQWSKVGIKIYETKVPIGATPQYLAGQYMLQSASSLLPVIALDPQMGQKILDMASAPGGKTTYIAQIMKNTGCIFANDLKKQRLRALQFNLYRLGITNTAVTCKDGRKYPSIFPGTFDRVLLDAPCTGLGIIAKDHSIKANRLLLDIYKNSHVQKQLLLAAIDCCKVNGTIVYSTCSISPLENQQVVNYALKRRFVKIVDCEIQVGEEGLTKFVQKRYHVDLKKTRRIYPHVHNMDGFYVAKLIKVQKGKRVITQEQQKEDRNEQRKYHNQQEKQQQMQIEQSEQLQDNQQQ